MHITSIRPAAAPAPVAPLADRAQQLAALRAEVANPIAFTAASHHGWGDVPPAPTTPGAA